MATNWIDILHQGQTFCANFLSESKYRPLQEALLCATSIHDDEARRLFIDTGLIHIMVVSGAHLHFLEKLLRFAPKPVQLFILALYCWLTGFGPPIVKAFVARIFAYVLRHRGLSLAQIEAVTVITILVVVPSWILSRSFLMSWLCGLAICLPRIFPIADLPLKIFIFLSLFTDGSIVSVLWNASLTPVIGNIMFPIGLLTVIFPVTTFFSDLLWQGFLYILNFGPQSAGPSYFFASHQLFWLPLLIHPLILYCEVKWRRAHAYS